MEMEPKTVFDRVAIAFGAMVIAGATALVAALPLFYILGLFWGTIDGLAELLFWKLPLLLGLFSAFLAFISPGFVIEWAGKVWRGILFLWRLIIGS